MSEHQAADGARNQLITAAAKLGWHDTFMPLAEPSGARDAAVLILFGVLDDRISTVPDAPVARDLDVLLQRRAATLSSHPSEVAFPGGRVDPGDVDARATALREAQEETGVDPSGVEILGVLPQVPLAASNHRVTPVLAWWQTPSRVAAVDHAETVEVLRVPVAQLLDPASRYSSTWTLGGRTMSAPAFDIDGTIVWGFTAMVLNAIFDATGWTVPWNVDDERPAPLDR